MPTVTEPSADPLAHTDASSWAELVGALNPAALQVVIGSAMGRKLREHVSPEDIWQETLTHAWRDRAQHRWRDLAGFRAWLFEIARNRIREAARTVATEKRGGGRRTARFSELAATPSASISADLPLDSTTPSRIVSLEEKKAAAHQALSELPPELGLIVRLYFIEGLTMEAIAERLGIGLSAAWRRYRKGAELLTRLFPPGTGDASTFLR